MTDLPTPPIPSEVDLRGYPYTPLFRSRLFGSSFHARANDAEWRAGVTLWLKSWDQAPAGSLPDDDTDLCRLAELGRDLRSWRKVKAMALHGWYRCSDGLLYHNVVAEGVLEAWGRRTSASRRGKAGASKRWASSDAPAVAQAMLQPSDADGSTIHDGCLSHQSDMLQPPNPDAPAVAQAMLGDSNRREGKGIERSSPDGLGAQALPTSKADRERRGTRCQGGDLPEDWAVAANESRARHGLPALNHRNLLLRWEDFSLYWQGLPGQRGLKLDWRATWVKNNIDPRTEAKFPPAPTLAATGTDDFRSW